MTCLLLFCAVLGKVTRQFETPQRATNGSALLSNLSVISTLTSIACPSSDHTCIHKCRSDMRRRNYPFSLLPSQFLGMRSLIRDGLETAGFDDTFCSAVSILLNMSILPLNQHAISNTHDKNAFHNLYIHLRTDKCPNF